MITIIHGEDTASSRLHFHEFKNKYPEGKVIQGDDISLTDLTQTFSGGDLFTNEKSVFIENFLSKRKQSGDFGTLLQVIKDKTLEHTIVLWEGKELDKKTLALFPHATIKNHALPQTLFLFLDQIKPGNGQQLIKSLYKTLETVEVEMIYYMMIRHVRILLALKDEGEEKIDEVRRLAPWQLQKLQRQARLFSVNQLIQLHSSLFNIDKRVKTGELNSSLNTAIDILLLQI